MVRTTLPLYVVDAFTTEPFKGNPAAVCLVTHNQVVSKDDKQKIASEMNLSETAFVRPVSSTDSFQTAYRFTLEWFTPTCEVDLCGHATLASSATLFFALGNSSKEIEFETRSGVLKAKLLENQKIQLDLPTKNYHSVKGKYHSLEKAVVASLPVEDLVLFENGKFLIRLSDSTTREELESIRIKDDQLVSAAPDIKGVIVTLKCVDKDDCRDDNGNTYDFISRYFAPWLGVSEDPVTGSAHAVLAKYWSKVLQKNSLYARQCSRRGGDLDIELVNDRAYISGNAVIVTKGEITY